MAGGDGAHMMSWNEDPHHYSDMFMVQHMNFLPTYDSKAHHWDGSVRPEDCCTEQDCTRDDICEVDRCCPQCKGDSCTDICKDPTCTDRECAVGECDEGDCDAVKCDVGGKCDVGKCDDVDCGVGKCDYPDCANVNCEDPHCSIAVHCEDDNCSIKDFCCCGSSSCQDCQTGNYSFAHQQWMQPMHAHSHDHHHYTGTSNHYHSTPQYSNICYDYTPAYDPIPVMKDREASVTTIATTTDILTPTSTQWTDNSNYLMDKSQINSQMHNIHTQSNPYLTCDWSSCGEGIPPELLFQHFQNTHLQAIETNNCSWAGCNASFSQQQDLLRHFGTTHMPSSYWQDNLVGSDMGNTMGSSMSNAMSSNMDDNMGHSMGRNVGNTMGSTLSNTDNTIGSTISNSMGSSMSDDMRNSMGNHIRNNMANGVGSNMSSNIGDNMSTNMGRNLGSGMTNGDVKNLMAQYDNEQAMMQASRYITPESSQMDYPGGLDDETDAGTILEDMGGDDCEEFVCRWRSDSHGFCGKRLDSAYDLLIHLKKEHVAGMEIREPKEFFCQWDGCDRIGKPFKQRGKVERHVQTHVGYKSICCGYPGCRREFANETLWLQHYRRHTGERPYVCEVPGCGKRFAQGSAFTMHKRSHTGERPLQCNYPGCGKRFAESSNLAKHRKTHNPIATLQCPFSGCSKSFRRMDQYKRHYKKQHGNEQTVPPQPVHRKESNLSDVAARMISV